METAPITPEEKARRSLAIVPSEARTGAPVGEVGDDMTIGEIIQRVLDKAPIQFVHECLVSVRSVNRKKDAPAHTRVEIATTEMTPNDALYWSGEFGRDESRKPKYVGVIVWIPRAEYDALVEQ
jgi:hypothetical protein